MYFYRKNQSIDLIINQSGKIKPMINLLGKKTFMFAVSKKQRNLYDVLKISRGASVQDVKASYYKLAKEYHPDTHQNKTNVAEMFKEINEAYNVLKDPAKRKQYDEQNFTVEGERKEYKFYDTQHNYGYNAKSYRKNPYQAANPFDSAFSGQGSYKQGNTNPYNNDFGNYYKQSQSSTNPNQSWQEYMRSEHRKNVAENRKTAFNRLKKSNMIKIIVLGVISVYIIGQLTFKIYQFNSFYRIRSYPEKLDPRELKEYQQQSRRAPRKDYY